MEGGIEGTVIPHHSLPPSLHPWMEVGMEVTFIPHHSLPPSLPPSIHPYLPSSLNEDGEREGGREGESFYHYFPTSIHPWMNEGREVTFIVSPLPPPLPPSLLPFILG